MLSKRPQGRQHQPNDGGGGLELAEMDEGLSLGLIRWLIDRLQSIVGPINPSSPSLSLHMQ